MFTISDAGAAPVLRDAARGWTYFGVGNVESVAFQQSLFRINDAGLADTQWRLPADFQTTEQYLAPDGAPIVRACVRTSPTYEQRWYRLRRKFGSNYTGRDFERVRFSPWNPDIEINSNVVSTIRVVRNRIVIADYIGGAPSVNRVTTFHLVDGRRLSQRFPYYSIGCIADDGSALSAHTAGHWAVLDTTRNDANGDQLSGARVGAAGNIKTAVPWRGAAVMQSLAIFCIGSTGTSTAT